jgi:hypothetical protein
MRWTINDRSVPMTTPFGIRGSNNKDDDHA